MSGDVNTLAKRHHLYSPFGFFVTDQCISPRNHSYSRINCFVTDQWLLQRLSSSFIHDITLSDHAAISIIIEERVPLSRTPLWRCNVKLLQDKIVFQYLQDFFSHNTHSVSDPYILWNSHKADIWGICIQQGVRIKKQYNL